MTAKKKSPTTADWYYYGSAWGYGRTSTWTQAHSFRMYWADVNGVGQKKAYEWKKFTKEELGNFNTYYNQVYKYLEPGDIVQYYYGGTTRHSQVVHRTSYEGGEYKVSMGQHSDADSGFGWRKLWQYIQDKPQGTIICLIKIKKPGSGANNTSNATIMSHQPLSSMSLEELQSEDNLLFNWCPNNENDENAKWERLASIKQEIGDRTFDEMSEFKLIATKDELLQLIDGRMEFDSICLSSVGQISYDREIQKPLAESQTLGINKPGNSQIINMIHEIEEIKAFRNTVLNCTEDQVEELWHQYWGDILKQDEPPCYVFE